MDAVVKAVQGLMAAQVVLATGCILDVALHAVHDQYREHRRDEVTDVGTARMVLDAVEAVRSGSVVSA